MNVKVTVGKVYNAFELKQKEDSNRIHLLEKSVIEKDQQVNALKEEISQMRVAMKRLQDENHDLNKENQFANNELKMLNNSKDKLKDTIVSSNKSNTDLIDSNNRLQLEVERLNMILSSKDKSEYKINEEYTQMTKIKNGFEDKIIGLSIRIDELNMKVASYEQMIKQKDKYIQMLLNNKKSTTLAACSPVVGFNQSVPIKPTSYINSKDYASHDTITNKGTDPNVVNNIIILKNKLTEKESKIYHLTEEIKALKKDNGNLLTRLKNANANNTLMKKAI